MHLKIGMGEKRNQNSPLRSVNELESFRKNLESENGGTCYVKLVERLALSPLPTMQAFASEIIIFKYSEHLIFVVYPAFIGHCRDFFSI